MGIVLPDALGRAGSAGADDVLDAAIAAWAADNIARGDGRSLPEGAAGGARGVIWS